MAFPANPSIGAQYTTPAGQTYEYVSAGGWALVRDTTFSVDYFLENGGIQANEDFILWYDVSAKVHRKVKFSQLAQLLGTNVTVTNPSGVALV